jgi:predicted metal-binding protein
VRNAATAPALHLFVCANRREGSSLGPGCSERGDQVYDALKGEVAARGLVRDVWITRTHCLGICPKHGATVARYRPGAQGEIFTETTPDDVPRLMAPLARDAEGGLAEALARELDALEALQREKVLALARRLKPGLTLEDVQNPHDFPELDDRDWHYADGLLAGIASVRSALRAILREREQASSDKDPTP